MSEESQRCRTCKVVKPISDYHISGARYSFVCSACREEAEKKAIAEEEERQRTAKEERRKKSIIYQQMYQKEYQEKNAEEIRAYQREYQKARYHRMKRAIGEPVISLVGDRPACPGCGGPTRKGGRTWISGVQVQRWQCKDCGYTFTKTWEENTNGEE